MNIIRNKFVHLGGNVKIWHHSNIYGTRKYPVQIGDDTQVGSFCEVKPGVTIGRRCRLQSFIFISEMTEISDDVFIGPHVLILNDKQPKYSKINMSLNPHESPTMSLSAAEPSLVRI